METLQSIKTRSTTINNLSKALDAIKMVSSVKLSKILKVDHLHGITLFQDSISRILCILGNYKSQFREDYINSTCNGPSLIIVFSSGQGFCGSFNNLITNEFKKLYSSLGSDTIVEVCGTKHKQYANADIINIKSMYEIDKSVNIVMNSIKHYLKNGLLNVYLIFAESKNSLVQVAKTNRLLPFVYENCSDDNCDYTYLVNNILVEGDPMSMYDNLLDIYMSSCVRTLVHKHVTAELSARVASLDSSVSNANEIHDSLVSKYNKTRQAKITQELTEIISSMECMR